MHEYEIKLLTFLNDGKEYTLEDVEDGTGLSTDQVLWALEGLSTHQAVNVKKESMKQALLSDEGREDLVTFPEEDLVRMLLGAKRMKLSDITNQVAFTWAKKNSWIKVEKDSILITEEGARTVSGEVKYPARVVLEKLGKSSANAFTVIAQNTDTVNALVKRGLVEIKEKNVVRSISITPAGILLLTNAPKDSGIGIVTKEVINSREWEKKTFKPYDVNAPVEVAYPARLHPLREFINVVRQNWFEMGFVEVSGPIIESAFWNFDALFSPQDHPTREMQDTFFLSNPKKLTIDDLETLQRVKKMHTGAWKEQWSEEIASSAVLRTHTTSVSARYMKKLSSAIDKNYPLRMFSIGQVFRNESIDYKHLAELHQCDGIIVGDNLTLANLMDTLKRFYTRLGMENVKFRPSYFPFTEPSVEVYYYDEEHGDSIELCGGGIIRKEITKAMGIDKTVLAWGMGLDRLLLNSKIFGMDFISTPFKNNIGWLRTRKNLKV